MKKETCHIVIPHVAFPHQLTKKHTDLSFEKIIRIELLWKKPKDNS